VWKNSITTSHITARGVTVLMIHATAIAVRVPGPIHVVTIKLPAISLRVVVTAMVPANAPTSSMCVDHGLVVPWLILSL